MATVFEFDGRSVIEPNAYGRFISGIPQQIPVASSGVVAIIDTGESTLGLDWGIGAGVNGELTNGKNAVYAFSDIQSFKSAIRGGAWWELAEYLTNPGIGVDGVDGIIYASARTSTAAEVALTLTNGGQVTIKTLKEGTIANGYEHNNVADRLLKGFSLSISVDPNNSSRFLFEFFEGSFEGVDNISGDLNQWSNSVTYNSGDTIMRNGIAFISKTASNTGNDPLLDSNATNWDIVEEGVRFFNNIAPRDSQPTRLVTSVSVSNLQEFVDWARDNFYFQQYFRITATGGNLNNPIIAADATANAFTVFTGGTQTYNATDLDDLLDEIVELQNSFFICDRWGANGNTQGVENNKILTFINEEAEFKKMMFIASGSANTELDTDSIVTANFYNSERVVVVHGGIQVADNFSNVGVREVPSIYTACITLGRIAGLEPQDPGTWKSLRITGLQHDMNLATRERALQAGVLHLRSVNGLGFVINQAVNSLQNNTQLINKDGASHEISIERIKLQLNLELILNSRVTFVGRSVASAANEDLKNFTEGYLQQRVATASADNLILSFQNVTVRREQDARFVEYGFEPNGPTNKIFFTGVILDSTISQN